MKTETEKRYPSADMRDIMRPRWKCMLSRISEWLGHSFLFLITALSAFSVFVIFFFILKDALIFFQKGNLKEFFFSVQWFPSREPAEFGAASIFFGSFMVTAGACIFAIPAGITTAVCLSDVLPFTLRQMLKPLIEILAAIPSVAYGFFALIVIAPLMQENGGQLIAIFFSLMSLPIGMVIIVAGDILDGKVSHLFKSEYSAKVFQIIVTAIFLCSEAALFYSLYNKLSLVKISSGTNALNASFILGIMILPTIISVSEDALQAVGRELREGSYALGATRTETILYVVIPAAAPGIISAIILGIMRAAGETMVVWMASGNSAKIPEPFFNFLEPVRTMTATIAGDMGEADHVSGSMRYHVLFALASCMLLISFALNIACEWIAKSNRRKVGGE
ncbi:MAG: phosphate ABC transporter permease subunit PstC [Candidatus Riflebacteria bacterium]|nr:phosphate ABC transporter permease subunit PstC [Candidatus Riflebacteria bacterium]